MRIVLSLALLLGACSQGNDVLDELPNSSLAGAPREDMAETRIEERLSRPVTTGEDGPRMDACGTVGQAVRVGGKGLAVHAAPFVDARQVGRMDEGARAWVCTRSLDQKWLGVVVAPAAGTVDCGVSDPIDRKQPYDGPCLSGWVSSASIRLIAG